MQKQVTSEPAWQSVSFTYSVTDKKLTATDPVGKVSTWTFDGADRLQTLTDAQSRQHQYAYDAINRLYTVTDPTSTVCDTRTYTTNGFLHQRTDARSKTTTWSYDGFDRMNKRTFADSSFEQNSSYDANGNVLTYVTRSGNTISMTWDVLNRLSTRAPQGQATVTNTFDLSGRLTKVSKPVVSGDPSTGDFEFFFDTAGRFYREQYADGKQVTHILDSNGNRTRTTWPDGYYITRDVDQLNRVTDIKLNGSGSSAAHLDYDQLSRRVKLTCSNGTNVCYSWAPNNDLAALVQNFASSSVNLNMGYNHVSQLVNNNPSNGSYGWHPSGGSTVAYGTADNANKYTTVGGVSYSYDGNMNLTGDGVWTFGYNTENQLTSASKTGVSASYLYDPIGRQAQKTVGSTKTRFIYDGSILIADYDTSGNLVNRYVHGGVDEALIQITASGTISFFHHDNQNSVIATSDNSGVVTNQYAYSPWGESPSLSGTSFGYTGQRYDTETGLHYFKARYLSASIGRFLQSDPIGYAAGLHLFAYVNNDPLNNSDSSGLVHQKPAPNKGPDYSNQRRDAPNGQIGISQGPGVTYYGEPTPKFPAPTDNRPWLPGMNWHEPSAPAKNVPTPTAQITGIVSTGLAPITGFMPPENERTPKEPFAGPNRFVPLPEVVEKHWVETFLKGAENYDFEKNRAEAWEAWVRLETLKRENKQKAEQILRNAPDKQYQPPAPQWGNP